MGDAAGRPALSVELPEVERDGRALRCRSWLVWPASNEVWYGASGAGTALARGLREDPLGMAALAVALHNHPDAGRVERLAELLAKHAGPARVVARQVLAAGWRAPLDDADGWESCRVPGDLSLLDARDVRGSCPRCGDLVAAHSRERGCAACWLREDPGRG